MTVDGFLIRSALIVAVADGILAFVALLRWLAG